MTRKGRLEEVLSKALHADDTALYTVVYRDFENLVEVSLSEFVILADNFSVIPASRIYQVKRCGQVMYEKVKT